MTALDRRTLMAATVAGIATPTALGANRVGSQIDQFFRERLHPVCISGTSSEVRSGDCGLPSTPAS